MNEMAKTHEFWTDQDQRQFAEIVADISAKLETGDAIPWDKLLNQYPEFADDLNKIRPALDGLDALRHLDHPQHDPTLDRDHRDKERRPLGDFQLLREIGRGGMGVVYEAEQLSLRRRVALKVLPLAALIERQALIRFRNEVQAVAALDHPHIVSVFSVGEDRGVHYYAMQLIRGQSLAEVLRTLNTVGQRTGSIHGGSIDQIVESAGGGDDQPTDFESSPDQAESEQQAVVTRAQGDTRTRPTHFDQAFFRNVARLAVQAAEALDHAHLHGVIHRDIKPGNLLLDGDGNLFVTDFGLARIEANPGVTMTGDFLGTLRYMSPEQILAKRVVIDQRTDIYSLGLTLYELLTLHPAFSVTERPELIRQISFDNPVAPTRLNPAIPKDLETIVLKAIRKNPAERYETAQQFADDLKRFLDHRPIVAQRPSISQRLSKWSQRHPGAVWTTVGVLVAMLIFTGVTTGIVLNQRNLLDVQRRRAEERTEFARRAVNEMYAKVATNWLSENEPQLHEVQREFLEKAIEFFEELNREGVTDATNQIDLADSYVSLGGLYLKLGQTANSQAAFKQAVSILQPVVVNEPSFVNLHKLATVEGNQVLVYLREMQFATALEFSTRCINWHADRMPFVADDEKQVEYQIRIARLYKLRGLANTNLGKRDQSLSDLQTTVEMLRGLLPHASGEWGLHHALAGALHNLAEFYQHKDSRNEKARELLNAAVKHSKIAADLNPRSRNVREFLGNHYALLGKLRHSTKIDLESAAQAAQEAVSIRKALAEDFPFFPTYRVGLAVSFLDLAMIKRVQHDLEAAEENLRKAIKECQELDIQFPDQSVDAPATQVMACLALSVILVESGGEAEASSLRDQADSIIRDATDKNFLQALCAALANSLTLKSTDPLALEACRYVVTIIRRLADIFPEDMLIQCQLGGDLHNLSIRLYKQSNYEEALEALEDAIEAQQLAHTTRPDITAAKLYLRNHYSFMCGILADCPVERLRDIGRAIEMGRAALEIDPNFFGAKLTLAVAYYRNGEPEKCKPLILEAVQQDTHEPETCFVLSATLAKLKEWDEAQRWFEEGLRRKEEMSSSDADTQRWHDEAINLLQVR